MPKGFVTKSKFINLTGHLINIYDKKGNQGRPRLILSIPPSGKVLRTNYKTFNEKYIDMQTGDINDNIPLSVNEYEVLECPPRKKHTIYIVPWLIAREMPNRWDIRFPNGQFKMPDGTKGCVSLGRYKKSEK